MSEAFYRDAHDALIGFMPDTLGAFNHRVHSRGLKVWFGDEHREHYEIQEVGMISHDGNDIVERGIEIGFHAEHRDPSMNAAVVDVLLAKQKIWRRALGADAVAGFFVNDRDQRWRRVSEFWTGPETDEPDTAIEAADRLAHYMIAFEPLRRPALTPLVTDDYFK